MRDVPPEFMSGIGRQLDYQERFKTAEHNEKTDSNLNFINMLVTFRNTFNQFLNTILCLNTLLTSWQIAAVILIKENLKNQNLLNTVYNKCQYY